MWTWSTSGRSSPAPGTAAPRRWPRPFKPKDAALFSVISGFDAAYTAYNGFQHGIERYWTLRWLQQNAVTELDASVMKDGLVRAETLPLVFRVPGTESLPRGSRVRVRITGIDLLTLDLHASWRRGWTHPAERGRRR
jgi:exoribonuclease-2